MKIRRYKQARRVLEFYKRNFQFHEPYQIIVDGTFTQAALKGKIQLKEQLPKYLDGEVKLVTTSCIVRELESLGQQLSGAVFVAKRFQLRSCRHGRNSLPAAQCILSLVGEDNPHHYFVACQDPELRKELRRVAAVPFLHIVRNTVVLEKPTLTSQDKAQQLIAARVEPSDYEKSVLEKLDASAGVDKRGEGTVAKRKKRKGPKGPNPLSVKKPTKMRLTGRTGVNSLKNKKRRQRMQIKRAIQSLGKSAVETPS